MKNHPLTHGHQATCSECIAKHAPLPIPRPPGSPPPQPPPARKTVAPPDFILKFEGELTEEVATKMRQFMSGATRDTEDGKYDYEGFLSPQVLQRFAEYMHKHREQSDGKLRSADNWQKGIPRDAYFKSLWRHFVDVWLIHRGRADLAREDADLEEALCACLFNIQGYLFEVLNGR